jgi:hypothetical protein
MKIYLVSQQNQEIQLRLIADAGWPNVLYSYVYTKIERDMSLPKGTDLLMDSGAYTASTCGIKIDREEYAEFVLRFGEMWGEHFSRITFFTLDVIGDQAKTWENFEWLRGKGIDVMPIITHNCTKDDVNRILEFDEFACGGVVFAPDDEIIRFLSVVYGRILEVRGKDRLPRVHLLGCTRENILNQFPVYSADTAAWIAPRKFGRSRYLGRIPNYSMGGKQVIPHACHPLDDLHPNNWNPNEMTGERMEETIQSILQLGFRDGLKVREVDGSLEIVDGEHRWAAMKEIIVRFKGGIISFPKVKANGDMFVRASDGKPLGPTEAHPDLKILCDREMAPVINYGPVGLKEAQLLTYKLNKIRGEHNLVKEADLFKKLIGENQDFSFLLRGMTSLTEQSVLDMIAAAEYDWKSFQDHLDQNGQEAPSDDEWATIEVRIPKMLYQCLNARETVSCTGSRYPRIARSLPRNLNPSETGSQSNC